jgi:hypothetical protein
VEGEGGGVTGDEWEGGGGGVEVEEDAVEEWGIWEL